VKFDGDSALLLFLISVGLVPVWGDLSEHRRVGGLTTLAMLVVTLATFGLLRRSLLLFRARALRRQLLASERLVR
jgi:hypothetical protein